MLLFPWALPSPCLLSHPQLGYPCSILCSFQPLIIQYSPLMCSSAWPGQEQSPEQGRPGLGLALHAAGYCAELPPLLFCFVAQPQRNCSNHLFGETIINPLPPSQRAGAAHGRCKNFTPCTQVGAHSSDLKKKQKKNTGHFMDISIQRPSRIWSHCEAHARKIHILIKL